MGKSWGQECEAAAHIASIVRKQREMKVGIQLKVPFVFSLRPQTMEFCSTTEGESSILS